VGERRSAHRPDLCARQGQQDAAAGELLAVRGPARRQRHLLRQPGSAGGSLLLLERCQRRPCHHAGRAQFNNLLASYGVDPSNPGRRTRRTGSIRT
jgi:hypothetical protein